jgi:beta-N-acetylhexosaminidase
MLAYEGHHLPPDIADRLAEAPAAGVTLFRHANVDSPGQVRQLTDAIQAAGRRFGGPAAPPLLVAADQETGQLVALGEATTPFAGAMALGAAGDPALTERVGAAIGAELRAVGVNVAYAPVCDLATNPANPAVGIRSFGDDPAAAGEHAAALVRGLQSAGIAAAAKHFPGLGEAAVDTHHGAARVDLDRQRLESVELRPFRMAIEAGVRLVMSAHVTVPALASETDRPATLDRAVMSDLLRDRLGFDGVSITDALDMAAIDQGSGLVAGVLAALDAGVDLLLTAPDAAKRRRIEAGLVEAAGRGGIDVERRRTSADRVIALRRWLASGPAAPDLEVVGSAAHQTLAQELAERAVTLVRDDAGLLPLRPDGARPVLVVQPQPADQTPADTSSTVPPLLADVVSSVIPQVRRIVVDHVPTDGQIVAARTAAEDAGLVVVGTDAAIAEPAQVRLVHALLASSTPVVTVSLRTPFDLTAYPVARTNVATYGILRPSLEALGLAMVGRIPFAGRLPVSLSIAAR